MNRFNFDRIGTVAGWALLGLTAFAIPHPARAVPWFPFGPDGGDARAFASDPQDHLHLYLGTANGWIYDSHDGGRVWKRLARVGRRDDLALDNIVVDEANPRHLLVGAWVLDHPDGGLYVSNDAGMTWTSHPELRGQSVRSLAQSHSNPRTLVAGTLQGVYRSVDAGQHWRVISPPGSTELHEVESIAIDPVDPNVIYAGTWHLPWKTVDGGEHWDNVKEGIIEDSDVFSIIVDPVAPQNVYLSACSGIYKSENAGGRFVKVQGIPSSARRTRVLMQDPKHLATVFAGTTEGLFRTADAGQTWLRTTGPEVIVNDVYVDETDPDHVLLATDRSGVLSSSDGGFSFRPSNSGFSARQITTFAQDLKQPATVFVGIVNDKDSGGVFQSDDGGLSWQQRSDGLMGRDVFSLTESRSDTLLAGTAHGVFRLEDGVWKPASSLAITKHPIAPRRTSSRRPASRSPKGRAAPTTSSPSLPAMPGPGFAASVYALATAEGGSFAATSSGLFGSDDDGASWAPIKTSAGDTGAQSWSFLAATHDMVVAATLDTIARSSDGGRTWTSVRLPERLPQLGAIAITEAGEIWVGGREGVFTTVDDGVSWHVPESLAVSGVNSLFYDESSKRMFLTASGANGMAFSVQLPANSVVFADTGWNLRFVRPVGDHLIAATLFDGMVVQPRMVVSPVPTATAAAR